MARMSFNLPTTAVKYGSVTHFHIMTEEINMDYELYKYTFTFFVSAGFLNLFTNMYKTRCQFNYVF